MTDSALKQHYYRQRAPAGSLPRALEAFADSRETSVRPQFWAPVVAAAMVFALWFGSYLPIDSRSGEAPPVSDGVLSASPVLARLQTPPRPTMPSLAALSLPSGSVAIPRLNQITLNPVNPEET